MILVLTFVYVFHGFQLHAAPLTSATGAACLTLPQGDGLLAESSSNAAVVKTHWHAYARPISERYGTSFRAASPRYASSRYSVQNANHLDISTLVRARHLEKLYKGKLMSLMHSIYPRILHKILTLDRGWTKTHGFFIDMGGFLPFEGDNAKGHGVLSPESGVAHGRKDRVSHCNCGRDRGS